MNEEQALRQKSETAWRSLLLGVSMFALFFAVASLFMDLGTALLVVSLSCVGTVLSARWSRVWLLRLRGARRLNERSAPVLMAVIRELAERADLPETPQLYWTPEAAPNAFAIGGKRHGAICVTEGLLRLMNRDEQVGVIAHEVAHIRNGDTFFLGLADSLQRFVGFLSGMGLVLLVVSFPAYLLGGHAMPLLPLLALLIAPQAMALLWFALSRSREFAADLAAAELIGSPDGLASALVKLDRVERGLFRRLLLPGQESTDSILLRSHPLTRERVRRLRALRPKPAFRWPWQSDAWLPRGFRVGLWGDESPRFGWFGRRY